MTTAPLEILYNGRCPVCKAGACDIERRAALARANVVLTDVAEQSEALARAGVTLEAVRLKMHAIAPDGRVLFGMPAVALAWAATPPYKRLGRLFQTAPFTWLGAAGYHVSAYVLYAWNKLRRRW